MNLFR